MILVSVVIPVYNIEAHLRQCLDSVLGQTLREIEVICVDDGSTDSSPDVLKEYARNDSRLHVITQVNAGPGVARNRGMAEATGKYLIFLDSDDWFEPDFLEQMLRRADETTADVVICKAVEFDTHTGKELPTEWMLKEQYLPGAVFAPEEVADHFFQFTYGMPWDKFYRRDWLIGTGIQYPPLKNSEDLAFVFPTLLASRKIAVLSKVMIHHRVNRGTSVSNSRTMQPDAPYKAFEIVEKFLKENNLMAQYEQSFMNWAMEFLVWHICNISDRNVQKRYLDIMRRKWIPALNFESYPISYYQNKVKYIKYLLVKYASEPILFAIICGYKKIKRAWLKRGWLGKEV